MKKLLTLTLALAMTVSLASCGKKETKEEPTELVVFAAASMQDTLEEIAELYKKQEPNVNITYNFDSSGTLKTQIEGGADCDLFISASPKQMNMLDGEVDAEKNPDGLDFVLQGTRINLLENKVVLVVPEDNPKGIESYDQLSQLLKDGEVLMSMGNSDVPVGQYTQKIFAYYGLDEETMAQNGKLTYGANVREVASQVKEGAVDCGVVYATDAASVGLHVVDQADKEMCGQVIYPAAVLNVTKNENAAKAFLAYLQTDESVKVFESVGFVPAF